MPYTNRSFEFQISLQHNGLPALTFCHSSRPGASVSHIHVGSAIVNLPVRPSQSYYMPANQPPLQVIMHADQQQQQQQPQYSQHGGFHHHQQHASIGGYADRHPRHHNIPSINTSRFLPQSLISDMSTPGTGYEMNFTPLLPSQLLLGSPFQPGSPHAFSPQFQSFGSFATSTQRTHQSTLPTISPTFLNHGIPTATIQNTHQQQQQQQLQIQHQRQQQQQQQQQQQYLLLAQQQQHQYQQQPETAYNSSDSAYSNNIGVTSSTPSAYHTLSPLEAMNMAVQPPPATSRTVYLGNLPPDTVAEEILNHVRSGQVESVRLLNDKNCAFVSFMDNSAATHFHSDAILKRLSINGQDIKVGWGKPSAVPTSVSTAVAQAAASRNVYLGTLPEDITIDEIRQGLQKFGAIDTIKLIRDKGIAFVHFLSIANAIKTVLQLPQEPGWGAPRRVFYGKDRCAYISKTQQQNAAQYLGLAPGHTLNGLDRDTITGVLTQQSIAAAAVASAAGGYSNMGNRTIYLGNIHPESSIEEICNVVRGGLLQHIRYIPEKHICFVTFIDPTSAASFYALSNRQGLMIHNRRLKIGWGKHSGALAPPVALAVSGGASRNVYIGNIDESFTEEKLRQDFAEYGEIELVNALREKSCAFVNFTNISNAIKAIEGIRQKESYKRFKVNFGKDRCANQPRTTYGNGNHMHEVASPPSPDRAYRESSPAQSSSSQNALANYLQHQSPPAVHAHAPSHSASIDNSLDNYDNNDNSDHSRNASNGGGDGGGVNAAMSIDGLLAPARIQHARAVSLPAFVQTSNGNDDDYDDSTHGHHHHDDEPSRASWASDEGFGVQ